MLIFEHCDVGNTLRLEALDGSPSCTLDKTALSLCNISNGFLRFSSSRFVLPSPQTGSSSSFNVVANVLLLALVLSELINT